MSITLWIWIRLRMGWYCNDLYLDRFNKLSNVIHDCCTAHPKIYARVYVWHVSMWIGTSAFYRYSPGLSTRMYVSTVWPNQTKHNKTIFLHTGYIVRTVIGNVYLHLLELSLHQTIFHHMDVRNVEILKKMLAKLCVYVYNVYYLTQLDILRSAL